jgi:spermidine synthase
MFIESAPNGWDMIMLDAFRGVFVPYHLKTQEFYAACLAKLGRDGVVVANLHNQTPMYPHDRRTLAEVFPQRYGFISESRNQTTFVGSASPVRVGTYAMRGGAKRLQGRFDFDLLGLAARHMLRRDYPLDGRVLTDDFDPSELEDAALRHNRTDGHHVYDAGY